MAGAKCASGDFSCWLSANAEMVGVVTASGALGGVLGYVGSNGLGGIRLPVIIPPNVAVAAGCGLAVAVAWGLFNALDSKSGWYASTNGKVAAVAGIGTWGLYAANVTALANLTSMGGGGRAAIYSALATAVASAVLG